MINWYGLSPEARNALVAEKVMNWRATPIPDYCNDAAAAGLATDEVERRGLTLIFVRHLLNLVTPSGAVRNPARVISATPEQRCIAALQAVGVEIRLHNGETT